MNATAAATKPTVFLSYALHDRHAADEVAGALRGAGLSVVQMSELEPGGEYTDTIRQALGRSSAIVVVLPKMSARRELPASVLFEIGAAVGADKPIFVIVDEPTAKLPFNVPHLHILPRARLDEVARQLSAAA